MYGARNSVRSQPSDSSIDWGHLVVCNQWLVWSGGARVVLLMWLGPCWIWLSPSASPGSFRAEPRGFSSEVIRHFLCWQASPTMRIPNAVASLLIPDPATGTGSLPPYYIQYSQRQTLRKWMEGDIYSTSQRRRANDFVAIISLPHLPNSAWSGSFTSIMLNSCNFSHSLLFKASMPLYLLVLCIWASFTFFWLTLSNSSSDIICCCPTSLNSLWLDITLIECLSYLLTDFIEIIF